MILGIGNDIIDIRRIEKTIARFGDKFIQRIFTEVEQKKSDRRANPCADFTSNTHRASQPCASEGLADHQRPDSFVGTTSRSPL